MAKIVLLILGVLFACESVAVAGDKGTGETLVGGRCEYRSYEGKARIVSIKKNPSADLSTQGYEVKFVFVSDSPVEEPFARVEGTEFLLLLTNSSYPGPKFLKKYGIKNGKVFACILKVITKGTCTPVLFEFPSIRLDDYFEYRN